MGYTEMEYTRWIGGILEFFDSCPDNIVSAEDALRPELRGLRMYDRPIFGVAAARDAVFRRFLDAEVVGPGFLLPEQWLPGAERVLSFFLPLSQAVRASNRQEQGGPSDAWLHARIEGQLLVNRLAEHIAGTLERAGYAAVVPSGDPRFAMIRPYASNWSERHVAYACGLGTFGLSRGLITKKGMAGRFGSVVTTAPLPVTPREYTDPFAYCTLCGSCQRMCPAQAIDASRGLLAGKDQARCAAFVDSTRRPPHGPRQRVRYGCGKCQVAVPCESCIPSGARGRKESAEKP